MDTVGRILLSARVNPEVFPQLVDAYSRMWGVCSSRYQNLRPSQRTQAKERLAGYLVLLASQSGEHPPATVEELIEVLLELATKTDLLLDQRRVLDFTGS